MNYHIIGAGGVGSWLMPALVKLIPDTDIITIWDGDTLEEGNMDRQLFDMRDIGENKARALSRKYRDEAACRILVETRYFARSGITLSGMSDHDRYETFFLGCADNHPARREILELCDMEGCRAIIGGNGYTDADAYYYHRDQRGSYCDPREYYPDILTDNTGSPIHADGCTGEAQKETPQLVLANYWAAAHMMHLLWYHTTKKPTLDEQFYEHIPMLSRNSAYMFETLTVGILEKQHELLYGQVRVK
jgi:hypothetical protein